MVSFFYKKTTLKFRFLLFLFKKMKQKLLQVILGITLLCFLFTNLETHASNQRINKNQTFSFEKFNQTLESLKSYKRKDRLTADMRNTLLDKIKEFWNHMIKNETSNLNECSISVKGKVRFWSAKQQLEYCNGNFRYRVPAWYVETDQLGIQVYFYMHHRNWNFPECPNGYEEIRTWVTKFGIWIRNWRSVLCYKKIETKTVPIWSKCIGNFWVDSQDGISFKLKFKKGKIDVDWDCMETTKEWELEQKVGINRGPRTRDLPISEYSY